MPGTVEERYQALVSSGAIEGNSSQHALARTFDRLNRRLAERRMQSKKNALGWFFARRGKPEPTKGLYVWGDVGRGKTMLMDLFFDTSPLRRKRRVHFHSFMQDVHDRIAAFRAREPDGGDPIAPVARALAQDMRLLCFDEFAVGDIADAMILGRLFSALFAEDVTVVATSNVHPEKLYENGLNRGLFEPFIDVLLAHVDVEHLDAGRDYRRDDALAGPVYVTPLGLRADRMLDHQFETLSGCAHGSRERVRVKGRTVTVPEAANGVARFSFDDLCAQPLAAADYLAIARSYQVIFLSDVPEMDESMRNEARRFITLIDTLYDAGIALIVSAAAPPDDLYRGPEGREAFEFARTESRLFEMQSPDYVAEAVARARAGQGVGSA